MRLAKMCAAVVMVASGVFGAACGPSTCAGASSVIVERGGSGGGASFSGSRSGSYSGGSSRGSGSGASYSGSRSGLGTYSGSRSGSYSGGSRTITLPSGQKATYSVPSRVGSSYSYYGHSFAYHPESYWLRLGAPDPYNPYDRRNFNNPFSPYYHYRLAVSGC